MEADKKKAANEKALVDTHPKFDVSSMTPAERNATLESRFVLFSSLLSVYSYCCVYRSRVTNARNLISPSISSGRNLSSRLGVNTTCLVQESNGRGRMQRPKLESNSKRALVHMLMESNDEDVFKNVDSLNMSDKSDEDESGPFKHPEDLETSQDDKLESSDGNVFKDVQSFEGDDLGPSSLQFDPDMDLSVPPPTFQRSKIYGSGRLSKSRLNDTCNLPDLLTDGAQCSNSFESEDFPSDEAFSPLSYPSLQMLAEALNTCQTNQPQLNGQAACPESYDNPSDDWPGMGNFDEFSSQPQLPEPSVPERKKSPLELRMEAVRRERCKRFSRAQYMAQDISSEVEITCVRNFPDFYPE